MATSIRSPAGQGGRAQVEAAEVMAMLQELQNMPGGLDKLPSDLAALMAEAQRAQGAAGAAAAANASEPGLDGVETEEITPEPGFVVKTHDVTGRKVFINVVAHPRVAAPGSNWSGGVLPDDVQQALDNVDNLSDVQAEALRFPLSTTAPRAELDKKGEPATCFDCCLNSDVVTACARHRPLKVFIIELAINWINHKHKLQLDPKYKLPKMRYKGGGAVEPQRIRVDKKRAVQEIRDVPDDPVFPLVTKKLPATVTKKPTAPAAAAGAVAGPSGAPAPPGASPAPPQQLPRKTQPEPSGPGPASPPAIRQLGQPKLMGRPVDGIELQFEVAGLPGGGGEVPGPSVAVSGQHVYVSAAPGLPEVRVELPLAVTSKGSSAQLDCTAKPHPVLTLRLPLWSVTAWVAAAAAQAPHAPGSLAFSSAATAMELEA